ncbi:potassium channel family protein [Mangrovibacillus cuniculi]|uniref:TrkA family potassium uptake protein n=1 Tax=Mangrovibacillus cuniculi TaxID=2593652 RepID=A0A7S8CDX5_9BACI|nr:TrkA family potassium uptake protein [Mangrovibacillus cuniculi]QPC48132.1 TrkA family potassium uptake protein [Mangrovibacillus cuniculi]
MKQVVVFGLGRFGGNLIKAFAPLNIEVLAVDSHQDKVNYFAQFATHAVQANAIDEHVLKDLGIRNFDLAVVSFGDDIEASILTCMQLKDIGVPVVWAKAQNDYHQKVLEKVGVDRIIQPERDMARRVAHYVTSEKVVDFIELSDQHSIIEVVATENVHLKTIKDLDFRAKFGCSIVGIQRGGDMIAVPMPEEMLREGDVLIVMGHNRDLARLEEQGV